MNVSGSRPRTSKSRLSAAGAANDGRNEPDDEADRSQSHALPDDHRQSRGSGDAPSAMRTPISGIRCETVYAITP